MAGLIDELAGDRQAQEPRIAGAAVATVLSNLDPTQGGRVQLQLPWLPGYEPWARVAAFSAGDSRGAFFMPQEGDEVLVVFSQGDVREPFVVGSLWNGTDQPPATGPNDPVSKRLIKTPAGHEVLLDDLEQSVAVTTSTGQKLTLAPEKITLETQGGTAKVTLETSGRIELKAELELVLDAATISIKGRSVDVKADASGSVDGGGALTLKGGVVSIN